MKHYIIFLSLLLLATGVQAAKDCTNSDPTIKFGNDYCDIPSNGTQIDGQQQITADPFYALDCIDTSTGLPAPTDINRLIMPAANLDCNGLDIGDVVVGSQTFDIFDAPERMTLVEETVRDLVLDRSQVNGVTGTGPVTVGTITDSVFTDTTDGSVILSMRVDLAPTLPQGGGQVQNEAEFNFFLRAGSTGYTVEAASSERRDGGLRLYNVARTTAKILNGATPFDPDWVRFQSDVNVSEGNPTSMYFHMKTDAQCYEEQADSIEANQAGEEGQPNVSVFIPAFVPAECSTQDVPVPWLAILVMAIVLGLIGGTARYKMH